jgi:hypothetical protein
MASELATSPKTTIGVGFWEQAVEMDGEHVQIQLMPGTSDSHM